MQEKRKAAEDLQDDRPTKKPSNRPSHLDAPHALIKAKRKADELIDERPTKKPAAYSAKSSTPVGVICVTCVTCDLITFLGIPGNPHLVDIAISPA
jgi:hypothetical protein